MDLTDIFGSEIRVTPLPRSSQRQRKGFAGAHGITSLNLGTRGYGLMITGTLRTTGASYTIARQNMMAAITAIQAYTTADAADYTYYGDTYGNLEFDNFKIIPDGSGKGLHFTSTGQITVKFKCTARGLL